MLYNRLSLEITEYDFVNTSNDNIVVEIVFGLEWGSVRPENCTFSIRTKRKKARNKFLFLFIFLL